MISVIVPVYNVSRYLDRCLDTVVRQSYENIEIILVDNNSDNETLAKEDEWLKRDNRIHRLLEREQGLGPARNAGVKAAKGEYVCFVDPDDWWDVRILEKLYRTLISNDADLCMCGQVHVLFDDIGRIIDKKNAIAPVLFSEEEYPRNIPELITMVEPSVCGKLYKRKLFTQNSIEAPNCTAEDRAVTCYVTYKAEKIVVVPEGLYYYHFQRKGSNMNSYKSYNTIPVCMEKIIEPFAKEGMKKEWIPVLRNACFDAAMIAVSPIDSLHEISKSEGWRKMISDIKDTFHDRFPVTSHRQFIIGSYSLRREVWHAYHDFEECRTHLQYASIISLMSESIPAVVNYSSNWQREEWIKEDLQKNFRDKWEFQDQDLIYIDFLEERFPIAKCNGSYFTYSDIISEATVKLPPYTVMELSEEERYKLWKSKCDLFVEWLLVKVRPRQIVLVKNLLCERHGVYRGETLFLGGEQIRSINARLNSYYDYFIKHIEGINVIETHSEEAMFSSEDFPFGCAPYHVNDYYYMRQGYRITQMVYDDMIRFCSKTKV
ncbi:MAG: glycosyltransferase family 2 protein [Lachnospiraceae bacterium]|nr:glycosyltransferase family 2 protein [Lachnospiraceae bacterium]